MRYRIYIAGPITKGNLAHNVNQATAAFVALAKAGFAPFNPMWSVYAKECRPRPRFEYDATPGCDDPYKWPLSDEECVCVGTRNGNDAMQHGDWLGIDLPWVEVAHAVLRLPGESAGADIETDHATACGIPVFTAVEALVAHFRSLRGAA